MLKRWGKRWQGEEEDGIKNYYYCYSLIWYFYNFCNLFGYNFYNYYYFLVFSWFLFLLFFAFLFIFISIFSSYIYHCTQDEEMMQSMGYDQRRAYIKVNKSIWMYKFVHMHACMKLWICMYICKHTCFFCPTVWKHFIDILISIILYELFQDNILII